MGGAYVALVLVQVFFATMAVAGKLALRDLPPLVLAAVRVVAGAAALLVVARLVDRMGVPSRADLRTFAILGLFGVFLNQALFITGLRYTSAVNAVLLIATIPAFTYLFSALRGDHRPDSLHVAGLALSFIGVGVIVGAGSFTKAEIVGDALVVVNAACYAWYLVISRDVVARHPPATVIAWTFVAGSIGILVVASPWLVALDWGGVPTRAWGWVAFIVAFPTVGSYLLNLVALRRLPSRTVAAFIYLQPLVGALLAVAVLDERLGVGTALGAALVLGGIGMVLVERRDTREIAMPG
ncbi:MAG TPA: DMT family transporter [Candidatus Thermoplasmatota archaeon]|nr:DMT family transporter [Candidatus Thermoplasmatota archaeon]